MATVKLPSDEKGIMTIHKEDEVLLALSTLGPGNYFKLPNLIVGRDGSKQAARSLDKELLACVVSSGFAFYDEKFQGYALSSKGAKRAMELLLVEMVMEPIDALDALVKFGAAVGIQKAEDNQFLINVLMGNTAYVAMHKDLKEAIRIVKKKIDQALIGS